VKLAEPLIDVERKPDAVALRPLADQRSSRGDRGGQMERGNLQVHAPGLDLGEVEDVVDEREQVPARLVDVLR